MTRVVFAYRHPPVQFVPEYPSLHVHTYSFPSVSLPLQTPPFLHGADLQEGWPILELFPIEQRQSEVIEGAMTKTETVDDICPSFAKMAVI